MKKFNGSPVPRFKVFTLADGMFIVQWGDKHVQELLTGRYRAYDHSRDFGHPITEHELKQLKAAGRVEHYDRNNVWLYPLPEKGRFHAKVLDRGDRVRVYYLSTAFPHSQLKHVQSLLIYHTLDQDIVARTREGSVVFLSKNGTPFRSFRGAQDAQTLLQKEAGNVWGDLTIAFLETKERPSYVSTSDSNSQILSLNDLIASQADTSAVAGRRIVMALRQDDERQAFTILLSENMKLEIKNAIKGSEAVRLLEDCHPDLLITDVQLADMHAWQLLRTMKEIKYLRDLPVVVIMNEQSVIPVENVEPIFRPVSMAKLRQNVWLVLKDRPDNLNSRSPC